MKKKIIVSELIIVIMVSLVALPALSNPILKSEDIYKTNNRTDTKGYYFFKVDISGVGKYSIGLPGFIFWNLTEGKVSIKSLFSTTSNFSQLPYKLFDKYNTTLPSNGILIWFIGTKSNDPFEIHGFSIWGFAGPS
jgi:hypothetical protein